MQTQDYFRSISVLRERMLRDNKLTVLHAHRLWVASFAWAAPAPMQSVTDVERQMGRKLPEDLALFLTSASDGAVLYRNIADAMTGYRIFGIGEFIEEQERWQRSLEGLWLPQFIAIGEITSENRPLIMDVNSPSKDGRSCMLMEGNVYDPVAHWLKLSQSFHEWIDRLVTAQGAQYWLWR